MRSFIFSSSHNPPHKPWLKIYLAAAALWLLALAGVEVGVRAGGFLPSLHDTPALWAMERGQVDGSARDVVLVGSSRFHLGIDADVLRDALPGKPRVHQLAITGGTALPVLEHLASDPDFRGTVLCEFHPERFGARNEAVRTGTTQYLKAWTSGALYSPAETRMVSALQARLVLLNPQLNLKGLLREVIARRALPVPSYRRLLPGRKMVAKAAPGMEAHDRKLAREARARTPRDEEELARRIARVRQAAQAIRARGGAVHFFRINASGETLRAEVELYPRDRYYARVAAAVGGRWLHFADDAVLRAIDCPDGSHVMGEGAARLSARLGAWLGAGSP